MCRCVQMVSPAAALSPEEFLHPGTEPVHAEVDHLYQIRDNRVAPERPLHPDNPAGWNISPDRVIAGPVIDKGAVPAGQDGPGERDWYRFAGRFPDNCRTPPGVDLLFSVPSG